MTHSHSADFYLRPYQDNDLEPALALWLKAWQHAYPDIDFSQRMPWWRARWENEILPVNDVVAALDRQNNLIGVVTITPATGYLDQIYVDPDWQGKDVAQALLNYAKTRCPEEVSLHVNQSNARAVNFYLREGFKIAGESVNPLSGLATYKMAWHHSIPSPLAGEG
jgi:putative acetyltransferase